MKQKSLRQLARELGVSHSYLSQIKHSKRPASAKVVSKMASSGKHQIDDSHSNNYNFRYAGVAELADAADLKSAGVILVGSSPTPGTSSPLCLAFSTDKLLVLQMQRRCI